MQWNTALENTQPNAELTSVAYWDSENQVEGIYTFHPTSVIVNADKTNIALINSETSEKVVLWLQNHPSSKFPEAITPGEKFLRAVLAARKPSKPLMPDVIISGTNDEAAQGKVVFRYDSNQRVMKFQVEFTDGEEE